MKGEPATWSAQAGHAVAPSGGASGWVVPWLDGARPTT
jgi:hypothetical protein